MATTQETVTSLLSRVILPRLKSETCENRRVLVVDDELITRSIAKVLLEKFGFARVEEAADGTAALTLLHQSEFALVISDCLMEPMNGLDLYRAMRSNRRLRQIPFVMLTASLSHDTVRAAKRAGVEHYLLKPFRLEALREKLVEVLLPYGEPV